MKKIVVPLLMTVVGFISCNNPSSQNIETYNLSDTTGYFEARNMLGLGAFKIEKSTYSEILNILKEEIRKDSRRYKETNYKETPLYDGYSPKYLDYKFDKTGNISSQFYREDFGGIFKEIKYDTISRFLKEDILNREIFGCPNIRELEMSKYYIGDIEITSLKLKFFNDTLYQINSWQSDKIEEGFKTKYGVGNLINNTVWKTPFGKTNIRPENDAVRQKSQLLKLDEKIIWQNELIITESHTYCEYRYEGEKFKDAGYSNSTFMICTKNKRILENIKICEDNAYIAKKKLKEQDKQKNINQL